MIYGELGATGLKTSVIGIGAGGPSRLGLAYGRSRANALALLRKGLERGINFFNSAATYGTESIIGDAVKDCRSKVILLDKGSTGASFRAIRQFSFSLEDSRLASERRRPSFFPHRLWKGA